MVIFHSYVKLPEGTNHSPDAARNWKMFRFHRRFVQDLHRQKLGISSPICDQDLSAIPQTGSNRIKNFDIYIYIYISIRYIYTLIYIYIYLTGSKLWFHIWHGQNSQSWIGFLHVGWSSCDIYIYIPIRYFPWTTVSIRFAHDVHGCPQDCTICVPSWTTIINYNPMYI